MIVESVYAPALWYPSNRTLERFATVHLTLMAVSIHTTHKEYVSNYMLDVVVYTCCVTFRYDMQGNIPSVTEPKGDNKCFVF